MPRPAPKQATITVYASIGNSDDKLPQARWSCYAEEFVTAIRRNAAQIHGIWFSLPNDHFQNACACFELTADKGHHLQLVLGDLRDAYDQDSIAWAVVNETEFV